MALPNVDEVLELAYKIVDLKQKPTEQEIDQACAACGKQIDCEKCRIGQYIAVTDYYNKKEKGKYTSGIVKTNNGYQYRGSEISD